MLDNEVVSPPIYHDKQSASLNLMDNRVMVDAKSEYDAIASEYNQSTDHSPYKDRLKARFTAFFRDVKPSSVIDLGCGAGTFTSLAKRLGAQRAVGVDISGAQIDLAKLGAAAGITYIEADVGDLLLDERFVLAVSAFGFCYAATKLRLQQQLIAVANHLESGGRLFMVVCHPTHPINHSGEVYRVYGEGEIISDGARLRCEFLCKDKVIAIDHKYFWSQVTWEELLSQAGFTNFKWEELGNKATNIILHATYQ